MKASKFARKTGKIIIPSAKKFTPSKKPIQADYIDRGDLSFNELDKPQVKYPYKFCHTNLKEGCYSISINSSSFTLFNQGWHGTIRVEKADDGTCISGDLYKKVRRFLMTKKAFTGVSDHDLVRADLRRPELLYENSYLEFPFYKKKIPVYSRRSYYAYLLGTSAQLYAITRRSGPCAFSLDFDLYEFEHDETGFEGTFPFAPTKSIRLSLEHTDIGNRYTGKMFEGETELGTVTMEWVSGYFRKAYLDIHTLQGAEAPQGVDGPDGAGTETFRTIFDTAGWDLTVSYKAPDITIPASIAGTQDSDECWDRENSHELLETVSTYGPSKLDKKWKVHLLAIEGRLGCSRGKMFDNEIDPTDIGDTNNVAREAAVTYSDDGYDHSNFGDNEDDLQKDTPRAFIRSAAHEVGHIFNMIHQNDEAGNDNSIMTTSPSVAGVLNDAGLDFPEDINLSFNALCRHHLIHRPDPWVRPGALEFTGSLAGSPEADDVYIYDSSRMKMELTLSKQNIKLGEILKVSWKVTNTSRNTIVSPERITDSSFTARVSITYPDGSIRFVRPVDANADIENPLTELKPGQSRASETTLFWNKKGFTFTNSGKHTIEINLMWANEGFYSCVNASEDLWVDYPVTVQENNVAALMLHEDVGRYVMLRGRKPIKKAIQRIEKVVSKYKVHPASEALKDVPGHRYSRVKLTKKKMTKPVTRKKIKTKIKRRR